MDTDPGFNDIDGSNVDNNEGNLLLKSLTENYIHMLKLQYFVMTYSCKNIIYTCQTSTKFGNLCLNATAYSLLLQIFSSIQRTNDIIL